MFRKQGVGSSLLKYVARKAAANNCSRIEWWVSRENKEARTFYKKMGAIALPGWNIFKCTQAGINNLIGMDGNYEHICIE